MAPLTRRQFGLGTVAAAAAATLAGCGSTTSGAPAGKTRNQNPNQSKASGGTLRVGQNWPPLSLDPAKVGGESALYINPAYEPLIYRAPDGSYQPGLATAWRYTGTGNTAFELTLRSGVTFSDGTAFDAAAVKANIAYYQQAKGQASVFLASIKTIDTPDPQTVRLTLSAPNPLLPAVFTQDYLAGAMISPAVLGTPAKLATGTYGAGPYMLDAAQTVAGDHYTYVRNPKYWNAADTHYDKLVLKVIPNESTALDALKTGQADVISGSYAIAASAKAAGFQALGSPAIVSGIQLNDRAGALVPALADQRVRQALNYAVDRDKITKALLGGFGTPTDQLAAPGGDGYNTDPFYTHDPAKARELLGEAGYANGFTLPVLISSTPAYPGDLTQAVAADLKQVGVTLKITAENPASAPPTDILKYPASILGWGVLPPFYMGRGLWLREAIGMNPFHSTDPQLEALDQQAAAAGPEQRAALDRQIVGRVRELGWFLPVCLEPLFVFGSAKVAFGAQPNQPLPSIVSWHAAG